MSKKKKKVSGCYEILSLNITKTNVQIKPLSPDLKKKIDVCFGLRSRSLACGSCCCQGLSFLCRKSRAQSAESFLIPSVTGATRVSVWPEPAALHCRASASLTFLTLPKALCVGQNFIFLALFQHFIAAIQIQVLRFALVKLYCLNPFIIIHWKLRSWSTVFAVLATPTLAHKMGCFRGQFKSPHQATQPLALMDAGWRWFSLFGEWL